MSFLGLTTLEERFRKTGNKGEYSLHPIAVPVPGEPLTLTGLLCTPKRRSGYYHDTAFPKERIVLHFTAGNLSGDMSTLTRQNFHVSVPFVIARDGTIYQLYSSKFWSGNLGKDALGNGNNGNNQDKHTIGIEISNYGPLIPVPGNLKTIYDDVYCSLLQREAYQKLDVPFRGNAHYATFTDAQYESLTVLLRYLTAQYGIPRQFLPEPKRYQTTQDVLTFKGIVSHVNYRPTDKWDIGPAFNWNRLITNVQADRFSPTLNRDAAITQDRDVAPERTYSVLVSEDDMIPFLPLPRAAALQDEPYEDAVGQPMPKETTTPERPADEAKKPKVYALLVGINAYHPDLILQGQVRFPQLYGCVHDATTVQTYLNENPNLDVDSQLLTDDKADKAAIVKAFREHLGQAKAGDVALFYFSGHGTQEWADTGVWTTETDGRLECLACYYDQTTVDDFLLADKELRYLIHELSATKAQIVTIFDCCNSGDNTRNGELVTTAFGFVAQKRIPFSFNQRDWNKFIFSKTLSRDAVKQQGVSAALPEGTHVQLAACESDESAMEVGGEGVFTKSLLTVLRTANGAISYYALRSRVRQYLRNVFEQRPRIYVANGDDALLYGNFLNQSGKVDQTTLGEVIYNEGKNRQAGTWLLNLGAIHGITKDGSVITITNPSNPADVYTAKAGIIQVDTTQLIFESAAPADLSLFYRATVPGLMALPIAVNVQNQDGMPEEQQQLMNELLERTSNYLTPEDNESQAQYVVHNREGRYYITYPNDPFRPLTDVVETTTETSVAQLSEQLRHISQWEFRKALTNTGANRLPDNPLLIEFFKVEPDGTKTPLDLTDNAIDVLYGKQAGGTWGNTIQVKVTNPNKTTKLYVSVLYLSSTFESFLKFVNPTTYLLEPGNSTFLSVNGDRIETQLSEAMTAYNWTSRNEYLKLIVSTDEFNAEALTLAELPEPPLPGIDNTPRRMRGNLKTTDKAIQLTGWTTQLYTLRSVNPEPNVVDKSQLQAMLNDPRTASFALGLFFDVHVGPNWEYTHTLKADLTERSGQAQLDERGFISDLGLDIANTIARRVRNQHYKQVVANFPYRVRIVSEGDSWFQHPLVTDIIDHLSRVYAIYCVASAGDTLRNMQKTSEYLNALDKQQPTVFLLSGGGNDILGEQFRTYLKDNPDMSGQPGENSGRFLKQELFDEMDSLRDIYRTIFMNLKTSKPDLFVLVHGYDYIIPLAATDKGWLGRYMIEKGINRQEDRQAIISFILDGFNQRMSDLAKEFTNVQYVDVRQTVRSSQWYDEIHPNSNGFQQVAMKFMNRINELTASCSWNDEGIWGKLINKVWVAFPEETIAMSPPPPPPPPPPPSPLPSPSEEMEIFTPDTSANTDVREVEVNVVPAAPNFSRGAEAIPAPPPPAPGIRDGQLDYDIPNSMPLNQETACKVRIGGSEVRADTIRISETSTHSIILIGEEMSVRLIGTDFTISSPSTERQSIWPGDVTNWSFFVTPKKAGRYPLRLQVTIHLNGRSKDLDVLEKDVLVNAGESTDELDGATDKKRILFMSANPTTSQPLRLAAEAREIEEELRMSNDRDKFLFTISPAVTTRTLTRSLLQENPTVVHFSGHGSEDGLSLETEAGASKLVGAEALGRVFASFSDSIQCVLLNACYSKSQADAIAESIPYVIGMQRTIGDEAAIAFATTFYQALGAGKSIVKAYQIALAGMSLEDNTQVDIPVLLQKKV